MLCHLDDLIAANEVKMVKRRFLTGKDWTDELLAENGLAIKLALRASIQHEEIKMVRMVLKYLQFQMETEPLDYQAELKNKISAAVASELDRTPFNKLDYTMCKLLHKYGHLNVYQYYDQPEPEQEIKRTNWLK